MPAFGTVDFQFKLFAPFKRVWFDLEERARQLAGLCVSRRDSIEALAAENGQSSLALELALREEIDSLLGRGKGGRDCLGRLLGERLVQ